MSVFDTNVGWLCPFAEACGSNDLKMVMKALDSGAIDANNTESIYQGLLTACQEGYVSVVEGIFSKRRKIQNSEVDASAHVILAKVLRVAIENNRTKVVMVLVSKVDTLHTYSDGLSILQLAIEHQCDKELCEFLLEADPRLATFQTVRGGPLLFAAASGNLSLAKLLLSAGTYINEADEQDGNTPLAMAVISQKADMMKLLIASGCDVNRQNKKGMTPLLLACKEFPIPGVRHLLDSCQIDTLDVSDIYGNTPLTIAAMGGNDIVVRHLINAGADVELVPKHSSCFYTPLQVAAMEDASDVARTLIILGRARLDTVTSSGAMIRSHEFSSRLLRDERVVTDCPFPGHSALMLAAVASKGGSHTIVKMLLEHGADMTLCTPKGETALTLAKGKKHTRVIKILNEYGRQVYSYTRQVGSKSSP